MKQRYITVGEAAKRKGCTRQAIHAAIKAERLEAEAEVVSKRVWKVCAKSLAELKVNPRMQRKAG